MASYEAGSTIREPAVEFASHETTVAQHLKRQGVETRYRRLSEAEWLWPLACVPTASR